MKYSIYIFDQMSEQLLYKPKPCAFHPKETIVNFCKNPQCLLPLCPTCIKVHTDEHRSQKSYGQFENIHKAVADLSKCFETIIKELKNCQEDMGEQQSKKVKEQEQLKKRIGQSKNKMIVIVERFFSDFEKEVAKSITCYNESMKESTQKVEEHVALLTKEVQEKMENLGNEKVLRTLIGFHAKKEEQHYWEEIDSIQTTINYLDTQKVEVVCQPAAAQSVIDSLGSYIHLSFLNWQNQIKYGSQFVKTGFMSTGSDGFQRHKA